MPLFIRIEAVGLEEGNLTAIATQAVMTALTAQTMPPLQVPDTLPIPAPPAFITDTLVVQ